MNCRHGLKPDAALSREALTEHIGQMAARLSVNGRARMRIHGNETGMRLTRLDARIQALEAEHTVSSPDMKWLSGNIRWVAQCAYAMGNDKSPLLPARDKITRIERIVREIAAHSDAKVSSEKLGGMLSAFDRVQGLDMGEIWLAPLALRLALIEIFCTVGTETADDWEARIRAEQWVAAGAHPQRIRKWPGSVFCEHALKILRDQDFSGARKALEEWMEARREESETVIRRAHERQALNRLAIENAVQSLREMDGANWERKFSEISRAEIMLRKDKIYPLMDEPSRDAVRRQVSKISRYTGLSEWTVARHAVKAAQYGEGAQSTCCWYLYDDEGRGALLKTLNMQDVRLPKMIPDPAGSVYIGSVTAIGLLIFWLLSAWAGRWYLLPGLFLLAWRYASVLTERVSAWVVKPRWMLKMDYKRLPHDARTLVVIPALLNNARRAEELCAQLETLGAHGDDENVEYLLLGDFSDGDSPKTDEDEIILHTARTCVAKMNARAGRKKFHYLHRARTFSERDRRFMGYERKRGALMALNQLLVEGDSFFEADEEDAPLLRGRFSYVLTLDADTRMLPDALYALVGAARHPLNRPRIENGQKKGFSVFVPRVETASSNAFARMLGGIGGLDSYPSQVSNTSQDVCGRGIFGGKGLYDVKAFYEALSGRIPEGMVLSHDLLEGALAGAALVSDVTVHDGFPATLGGYLKRSHRWTRGDWQLMPFIFGKNGPDIFGRFLMLSNIARSLSKSAALWTLTLSIWTGVPGGAAAALIEPFLGVLAGLPSVNARTLLQGMARFSVLPAEAYVQTDAAVRALYRMFVSGKNLLQWTTAAEADRDSGGMELTFGKMLAVCMLPAAFRGGWLPAAVGTGVAFWRGVDWMRSLQRNASEQKTDAGQMEVIRDLAKRTWRFFETYVSEEGPGLPPDNVQTDPPVGPARRTSPTNIGLYLMSCLAAWELGFITHGQFEKRTARTVQTLETLPKWKGHLYNWYDTEDLSPLTPQYVSAVDSGNLAAALLMTASALEKSETGAKMEKLAKNMNFAALYDAERKLFYIGYDAAGDRMSDAHYDLLASESRILSYTAIALGQAPVKHWFRLGRPRSGKSLLSWSGTLFEYLMPELFMSAPRDSLLYESNRAVIEAQKKAHPEAWGVSESGFYAFDLQMNYQYRAFGLSSLSLRGGFFDNVIAPYGSVLALDTDRQAAVENILRMKENGWMGDMGFYEAVDMDPARLPENVSSRVIMSHMTHHQGMILVACANALTGGKLRSYFTQRPEMRSVSLLLEEKYVKAPSRSCRKTDAAPLLHRPHVRLTRQGNDDFCLPDGHLLYGGGTTCYITAGGEGFMRTRGILANRFREGLMPGEADGMYVHVKVDGQYAKLYGKARFGEGEVKFTGNVGQNAITLACSVSPEDGVFNQQVFLENQGKMPSEIEIIGCFAVTLCSQGDMEAHPAFQNLFVSAETPAQGVLLFKRRSRRREEPDVCLTYKMIAPPQARYSFETDLTKLVGRDGQLNRPETFPAEFQGGEGPALTPAAALKARFSLASGGKCQTVFSTAISIGEQEARLLQSHMGREAAQRSALLAQSHAHAMLEFLSIDPAGHHLLQRASSFLFYPGCRPADRKCPEGELPGLEGLWTLGISGDLPLITVFVLGKDHISLAREAIRAHEFYRAVGVWTDIALVNDYGNDYLQPVRDQLRQMIEQSHLRELENKPGGAYMIDGKTLAPAQREMLKTVSALCFEGGTGSLYAQLRRMMNFPPKDRSERRRMSAGTLEAYHGKLLEAGGFGGFVPEKNSFLIETAEGENTPAAWCNMLAHPRFGCMISERGGMFLWVGNSRMRRLTPWLGDGLREGFPLTIEVNQPENGQYARLIPAMSPVRCLHTQGMTEIRGCAKELDWTLRFFVPPEETALYIRILMKNKSDRSQNLTLEAACGFLMGVHARDKRLTRIWGEDGLMMARGVIPGVGYLAMPLGKYAGQSLQRQIRLEPGEGWEGTMLLGWQETSEDCRRRLAVMTNEIAEEKQTYTLNTWNGMLSKLQICLPDPAMNEMLNRFLPYQAMAGRVYGRAGLYQAGGAYGFRDQLQDVLCLMPFAPGLAKKHLIVCAAHQFEDGDVLHWWHEPAMGVRTRISDDMLFLPYVTACYVKETGDRSILEEGIPYLKGMPLEENREDVYAPMETGDRVESLHRHCMRAIRRASGVGDHGLPLMGAGDWNDGMNRVRGESVWLGEFLCVTARMYAEECAGAEEKEELMSLSRRMLEAVEAAGWNGKWYRRAFFKNGEPMGENGCGIDMIAQGWAAAAGVREERCLSAMDEAWHRLVDEKNSIVKLLTPPFDGQGQDPGYIAAYPKGVRENGGQYTHGACWGVMGWARLGQARRAWTAYRMLMPYTHTENMKAAEKYRLEPYAVAADIYGEPPLTGRGGWSWYTGAAGWLHRIALCELMGCERRENRVRLRALLPPEWDEASVRIREGGSEYVLTARKNTEKILLDGKEWPEEWIELSDDGKTHTAVFPLRKDMAAR